jgi:hypothetical protein
MFLELIVRDWKTFFREARASDPDLWTIAELS